ncbi:MAG: formimidoylglutamase [Oligoflexia bacterium]|nr:formimidoylglutamase [Oligoflexia bacterium]
MPQRINWSLVGVPDHLGIINVGGRIGAALGPAAFRNAFSRLKGRDPIHERMLDCGDLGQLSGDLQQNLVNASELIRNAHRANGLSVIVGGSQDHAYSHLLGVARALDMKLPAGRLGCINVDSHLDVRPPHPLITSGSAFQLAIEGGVLTPQHLVEFGTQSHCNGPELWDYVERRKVKVVPFENLRHDKAIDSFKSVLKKLTAACDAVVISLDLDSAASAFAPGVSAPQAEGFTPTDLLEIAEACGEERKVVSLGIFELSPPHDEGERTANLAATTAYHFVARALRRSR